MTLIRRALGFPVDEPERDPVKAAVWRRVNEQAARIKALDAQVQVTVERRRHPR